MDVNISIIYNLSNRSECRNGFPLEISLNGSAEESTKMLDIEFNAEQIKHIIKKVDWGVLVKSASQFGISLPLSYSEQDFDDEFFLCAVHDAILRVGYYLYFFFLNLTIIVSNYGGGVDLPIM